MQAWRLTLTNIFKNMDIMVGLAFVLIVAIIVIPINPLLLDILLVVNIAFSLIVILSTLFITELLQLATFPSVLLVTTLFRLALNISSTRLILTRAEAGAVINAFGVFVVGGNYVVGLIIFIIITLVQFVVITSGAGRIAEVAARFTLDAMPGKQMSIDADFNAGLVDEEEARQRRRNLQKEADFFGAMDGASKFVRGDAIAGVVIVLINICGGLAIGALQRGMDLAVAARTYTVLTVGDGLVAQIPALLISTAAAMLVTRSTADEGFGTDLTAQFFSFPKVLALCAFVLFSLGVIPALPFMPFFILAAACGFGAWLLFKEEQAGKVREKAVAAAGEKPLPPVEEELRSLLRADLLEVEIGYNLVSLTEKKKNGDLLQRITAARRRMSAELGIIVRPIRIRDNIQLPPHTYVIKLKGNEIARGELRPGYILALNPPEVSLAALGGLPTQEPTFNLPAAWLLPEQKEEAELQGCTVVDVITVLITHLTEVIRTHAHELLGRQEVKEMVEMVRETRPAVVEELLPDLMSVGEVQKILQNLLKEDVPLLDLPSILEVLADFAPAGKDPDVLTEYVRQSVSRTISARFAVDGTKLQAITLDPLLEKWIADALQETVQGTYPVLEPEATQRILQGVSRLVEQLRQKGLSPVVLTSSQIRLPFRRLVERYLPDLAVLSFHEIQPQLEVESVGVLSADES
ncbi:MAG: flagellar biosynthesis protein FlhA [Firmicutes bacterium]|nr:flagellar biosynthesis protein FlhA [Bacillota bacterium]